MPNSDGYEPLIQSATASISSNHGAATRDSRTVCSKGARMIVEWWRQFWLLTVKNLILMKRSKLWTFFEIVLPLLFTLPIVLAIVKFSNTHDNPAMSFKAVPLNGSYSDLDAQISFLSTVKRRWCSKERLKIAYYAPPNYGKAADMLMTEFQNRYDDPPYRLDGVRYANINDFRSVLRSDPPNSSNLCYLKEFIGGISFIKVDMNTRTLEYEILLPAKIHVMAQDWDLGSNWDDPYGPNTDFSRLPPTPPYWTSGFLSLQQAIDSVFIDNVTGGGVLDEQHILLQRLPEPEYRVNSVAAFLTFLPAIWGMCAFLTVIHTAREIAHEKYTVKAFLSVMGLSTPMFYLSHIVFSWYKCCIIFIFCAIPLTTVMTNVSTSLFLFTVLFYGAGVVTFAALIASMFKTPNSALKVAIVLWVLIVGLTYYRTPKSEDHVLCALVSLNINCAFYMVVRAMTEYMNREAQLGWGNMFEGGSLQFTAGHGLIMIFVDIVWMGALTLVFDYLLGNNDFSLRNFFTSPSYDETDASRSTILADANETDAGLASSKPDIEVENLIKVWSETGERAVDGLTLSAYPGQVTVLLGHNGAGKSTTFSMICGIVQPTRGTVKICREAVAHSSYRQNVGLCPQGNALFDKLTVREHLWFIHGLKGATSNYREEGTDLLDALKLDGKDDELSSNLSGGMKRKLCVSMALIGGSKVILLDEPTAGMDPGARRDVERLLEREKKYRAVLLTTHYMDEAELLGDRVAIMAKGRVVCSGSPQYLKNRFGTGYLLTIVVEDGRDAHEDAKGLLKLASAYVGGAKQGDIHGRQLEIVLPKEQQHGFPKLFEELEKRKEELYISNFGLSLNTLEQVFLRVGEISDPAGSVEYADANNLNQELINSQQAERYTGFPLIRSQLIGVLLKRFNYARRNLPQLVTQVVVPLLILGLLAYVSKITGGSGPNSIADDETRRFDLEGFGPSKVILHRMDKSNISDIYRELSKASSNKQLFESGLNENLTAVSMGMPKDLPATGFGAAISEKEIKVLFNSRALHSLPTSLNLVNNARLRAAAGNGSITVWLRAYGLPPPQSSGSVSQQTGSVDLILGPLLVLALALLTSTFVMFLVEERSSKFAHQQSLTGISPVVFWGGSFLYDFVFYVLVCSLFITIFVISGWMQGYMHFVILMFLLYFWACVPFVYTVSFIFSSPSKANVLLIIWQLVAALSAMLIIYIASNIPMMADPKLLELARSLLLFCIPSFAVGNGLMTLGGASSSHMDPKKMWEWDNLGKNLVFMTSFGCFSSLVFLAFQFKQVRFWWFKIWDIRRRNCHVQCTVERVEDDDVTREREKLLGLSAADSSELALEVKSMSKSFGVVTAVDTLTMGVRNGECFGLLGVNGAGKTTTFDILTGQSFPSSGSAKIAGHDVTEHIAIGYCPQFDAMMMDLSGREILTTIARMYGFKRPSEKAELVLRAVGMEEHGDKLVRYYSGGQRRKVSTGLALLASTRIVILDEPTAGIDPKARRDIWEVLSCVRDNSSSALLLTSHSMDECEALCSRIAILNKGRMIAIGTSQALKSKFGNSYTLTMVVECTAERGNVINEVAAEFNDSILKTNKGSHSLTLKWQIPKSPLDRWSSMFSRCQQLAGRLPVSDFCLAQSSLEETFLRLAGQSEHSEDSSDISRSVSENMEVPPRPPVLPLI